jgi:hypothetical protein
MDEDSAKVRFPPPLTFLLCLIAGYVVHYFKPVPVLNNDFGWLIGALFIAVGIIMMARCILLQPVSMHLRAIQFICR